MESGPVIEPSEIITPRDEEIHRQARKPNPWIRFIARYVDYSLFFFLLHIVSAPISLPGIGRLIPLEFLAWLPVETLLMMTWGTTPGKWLLATEVKKGYSGRLPFRSAFLRSFFVYFRGIGMGIAIINILCMLNAFYRLRLFQPTSWDRDAGTVVIHHPLPKWRYYLASGIVVAGMISYSFWKKAWM